MANSLAYITGYVTREALRTLEGSIAFAKHARRDLDKYYAKSGAKIGYTCNVRVPPIYSITSGPNLSLQDTTENVVAVTLTSQEHVDIYFQNTDLVLEVDDFYKRFVEQGVVRLASQIDSDGLALWKSVPNAVGTPGTSPSTVAVPLNALQYLNENLAPKNIKNRALVINPSTEASMVGALTNLFNPQSEISKQYEEGSMGTALGFKWEMDQQVQSMTTGTHGSGPFSVLAAPTAGTSSITLAGFPVSTSNVLNQGEVFQVAGTHKVNAQTKAPYATLKQFVVTSTGNNSNASGQVTVTVSPAFNDGTTSPSNQNIDVLPATSAVVTLFGAAAVTSPQNLAFHSEAFALVSADLELAGYGDIDGRINDPDVGLSLAIKRIYDINTDKKPCRIDVLYGWAALRPEFACRVAA